MPAKSTSGGQLWRHHRPIPRRRSFNEPTRAKLEAEERALASLVGHEEEILGRARGDTDEGTPIAHRYFELRQGKDIITSGITDPEGYTGIRKSAFIEGMSIRLRRGQG